MALAVKRTSTFSGGEFFKPDAYESAEVILAEVTRFDAQVPGGQYGPKDIVTADLTIFATAADIASDKATILKGAKINQTYLAADLQGVVGAAAVVKLGKTKSGKGWNWRDIHDDAVMNALGAYVDRRDAAVTAAAASAPSFD